MRPQVQDELQWVQTSHLLSMLYNINRRKDAKAAEWTDFSPYEVAKVKTVPPAQVTADTVALFGRMKTAMNNETNSSTKDIIRGGH